MQGTCRQDVWIVDGTCMAAYFQDFQFKRASRSHAKTGFFWVPRGVLNTTFEILFDTIFSGVFLEVTFSHFL